MEKTGYLAFWQDSEDEEADERLENLSELVNAITEYIDRSDPATLEGFLEEVSLLTDIDELKEGDQEFVTLMTLHASKGLEFERVFIAGLEDGLFPMVRDNDGENEHEEERRLFYVGLTRAKKFAALFHAVFRRRFGSAMACLPSPFLDEVPEECVRRLDRTAQSRPQGEERAQARPAARSGEPAAPVTRYEDYSQEEISYRKGMRVIHPLWGAGTITGLSGFDDNLKATVKFDNTAEKKLLLKYAKLEPVNS
jgi:DNA helicase-2/ATP-dependent DNA helicase PcrA